MPFEFRHIYSKKPWMHPKVIVFEEHSPLLVGMPVFFRGEKFLRTSPVKYIIERPDDNIWTIITVSESIYEIRKI